MMTSSSSMEAKAKAGGRNGGDLNKHPAMKGKSKSDAEKPKAKTKSAAPKKAGRPVVVKKTVKGPAK